MAWFDTDADDFYHQRRREERDRINIMILDKGRQHDQAKVTAFGIPLEQMSWNELLAVCYMDARTIRHLSEELHAHRPAPIQQCPESVPDYQI